MVTIKSTIFWDVMPRTLPQRRFGRTYSFHLQGQRLRPVSNQQKSGHKQICVFSGSGYFLVTYCSVFYPENESSTFVRNVSELLPTYSMSVSRRQHSPRRTLATCKRGAITRIRGKGRNLFPVNTDFTKKDDQWVRNSETLENNELWCHLVRILLVYWQSILIC
jgi:hypothetical protein